MIKINNLYKSFNNGENKLEVLKDLNLSVEDGEFIAIMGKSGNGKSTLLKIIGLLDNKYSGNIIFNNTNVSESQSDEEISKLRSNNIGFVFQDFQLIERLTVRKNIELALICCGQYDKKENEEKIIEALNSVELLDKIDSKITNLSGGQKQRVCIARAIVKKPTILLADEPTGALDSKTTNNILGLFKKINKQGQTIIVVTHDDEVSNICDKTYNLRDGELHEEKIS